MKIIFGFLYLLFLASFAFGQTETKPIDSNIQFDISILKSDIKEIKKTNLFNVSYRNNTDKQLKYLEFYISNVRDDLKCEIDRWLIIIGIFVTVIVSLFSFINYSRIRSYKADVNRARADLAELKVIKASILADYEDFRDEIKRRAAAGLPNESPFIPSVFSSTDKPAGDSNA